MIEVAIAVTSLGLGLIARDTILRVRRLGHERVERAELDAIRREVADLDDRVSGLALER